MVDRSNGSGTRIGWQRRGDDLAETPYFFSGKASATHNVAMFVSVSLVARRRAAHRALPIVCASHFGPPAMSLDSGCHARCMEDRIQIRYDNG